MYIKEAREELQKICRVLLQKKLEIEDRTAEVITNNRYKCSNCLKTILILYLFSQSNLYTVFTISDPISYIIIIDEGSDGSMA